MKGWITRIRDYVRPPRLWVEEPRFNERWGEWYPSTDDDEGDGDWGVSLPNYDGPAVAPGECVEVNVEITLLSSPHNEHRGVMKTDTVTEDDWRGPSTTAGSVKLTAITPVI
jgi:hypothetical protein